MLKDATTNEFVLHGGAFVQANNVKKCIFKNIIY